MKDFSQTPIAELAAIVATHLHQQGIEVVLVGGLAVELYTQNLYLTKDIDMVNTSYQKPKQMQQAMAELGFSKHGRIFVNDTTDITVEFPPAPLSVGDELIHITTFVNVADRCIPILHVDDVIKDRLAAFIHWRDNQSLVQATAIMLKHQRTPEQFQTFCQREGDNKQYHLLHQLVGLAKRKQLLTMAQLEAELSQLLLNKLLD